MLTLEPVSDVVYLLKKAEMEGALEKKAVLHALVCFLLCVALRPPVLERRAQRTFAALLFALHALPPVRRHYAQSEPELVADLERRVLSAVVPAFLAGMAQRPEALVVLTSTLTSMWREPMGEDGPVPGAPPRQGKEEEEEQGAEGAHA